MAVNSFAAQIGLDQVICKKVLPSHPQLRVKVKRADDARSFEDRIDHEFWSNEWLGKLFKTKIYKFAQFNFTCKFASG